jgi:hypothetical protein
MKSRFSRRCVIGYAAIAPAVLVLIVRLQDANKIGHAGSIAVFGRNRNPRIRRGLAPLPNPEQQIGDVFHGVLSATNRGSGNQLLQRQRAARSGEGRRALRRRPCPATAGSRAGSVALPSAFTGSTGHPVDAIARGYEATVLRSPRTNESG